MSLDPSQEKALLTEILDPEIADNPFAAVMFFFPWGKSECHGLGSWGGQVGADLLAHLVDDEHQTRFHDHCGSQ
jgi:hypothetical protein